MNDTFEVAERRQKSPLPLLLTGIVFGLVLIGIGVFGMLPLLQQGLGSEGLRVGGAAPELTAALLQNGQPGEQVHLSDLRGRPVLVNFWATWCAPCREEFPTLDNAYRRYKDSHDLVVIGVDVYSDSGPDQVQQFLGRAGTLFPIWLAQDWGPEQNFGIQALPTSVFIDRQGIVRDFIIGGPIPSKRLEEELAEIL